MRPLVWMADLHTSSSYALSARRLLPMLQQAGIPLRAIPLTLLPGTALQADPAWMTWLQAYQADWAWAQQVNAVRVYHHVPHPTWLQLPPGWAYTGWDARPYPKVWVEVLRRQEGVILWSDWTRRQLGDEVPAQVVPLPPTLDLPRTWIPRSGQPVRVGILGQAVPRKRILESVERVWEIFTASDPVELWVHVTPSPQYSVTRLTLDLRARRKRFARIVPTYVWMGHWTPNQLRRFYTQLDILAVASAGEGYGLPMLEAAMAGATLVVPADGGGWEDWLDPAIPRVPARWEPIPPNQIPDWQEPGMEWVTFRWADWQQRLWALVQSADQRQAEQQQAHASAWAWADPARITTQWLSWFAAVATPTTAPRSS